MTTIQSHRCNACGTNSAQGGAAVWPELCVHCQVAAMQRDTLCTGCNQPRLWSFEAQRGRVCRWCQCDEANVLRVASKLGAATAREISQHTTWLTHTETTAVLMRLWKQGRVKLAMMGNDAHVEVIA